MAITRSQRARTSFCLAVLVLGLLSTSFLLWMVFHLGGSRLSGQVDDLGELLAALVAAAACAAAARSDGDARVGWLLLAMSSFAWACGEAIWCWYDLVRGVELPYPSLADVGFLTAIPLATFGLRQLFPDPARSANVERQRMFEVALVGLAILVVSMTTVLLHGPAANGLLTNLIGLAYPLGDLVMAFVVLAAIRRGAGDRTTMRLVLMGILAFTVADTAFAILARAGSYGSMDWLDSGWVFGYFMVALGAIWAPGRDQSELVTTVTMPRGSRAPRPHDQTGLIVAEADLNWHALPGGVRTRSRLTAANTDHVVHLTAMALILADAGLFLYDLAGILKVANV